MDKRQQSFFVFSHFWLDRNSPNIVGKSPLSLSKKQNSVNVPEQDRERDSGFKVGDRVKPSDPDRERRQDTGIVESIEGEQYVAQWQRDRNVRRYTRDELTVAI